MNRIYKTIKKTLTGETAVTSERSKNRSSIQKTTQCTRQNAAQNTCIYSAYPDYKAYQYNVPDAMRPIRNTTPLLRIAIGAMLLTSFGSGAYAQQIVYDGSAGAGKATLEQVNYSGLDELPWLNINSSDEGLIYRNSSNNIVNMGADLVVNYAGSVTAPAFVVGGFDWGGRSS